MDGDAVCRDQRRSPLDTKYERAATGGQAWEEFYEWRIAVSHFTEACLHLKQGRAVPEVVAFLAREQTLQERFDEVINRYEDVRALAHRVRNQAAFHYAYEGGAEAVAAALTRMADDDGWFGGEDERLRGGRWHYADDLLARLVYDAAGGGEDAYADAAARVAEGVAAFARFANAALDAYFVSHANSVRQQEPVPKHVMEGG